MSQIHDNEILSYTVDFKKKKIIFLTKYTSKTLNENTTIEFLNVTIHLFENAIEGSIILDITKCSIKDFITNNKELLEKKKNYCWPMFYDTESELTQKLNDKKQSYFVISSALGLCGWILAEDMKIIVKNEATEIAK